MTALSENRICWRKMKSEKKTSVAKSKDLLWHQRNPRARQLKTEPLERDSRTSTKNLSTRAGKKNLRAARFFTGQETKRKTEQQTDVRTRSLRTLLRSQ
jgi:type II secretory pathway component HofQ